MKFFGVKEFFFVNFYFKNGCKNEFEDNKEKSCSRFKNRAPLKINFRADWTHESIPTAWEFLEFPATRLFDTSNLFSFCKIKNILTGIFTKYLWLKFLLKVYKVQDFFNVYALELG